MDADRSHSVDQLRLYARSAAVWCWLHHIPDWDVTKCRSPLLQPWPLADSRKNVVDWTCAQRESLLLSGSHEKARERVEQYSRTPSGPPSLLSGRLLVCFPDVVLWEGMSASETSGYLDLTDSPPWDTWVGWIDKPSQDSHLIAWVHPVWIKAVESAIPFSPTDTLKWLEEFDPELNAAIVR